MSLHRNYIIKLLAFCIFGSSCQKVSDWSATPEENPPAVPSRAENLGQIFSGTNVSWKLHPYGGGEVPLFMHLPYNNSGYSLLMIDNGKMNGYTPVSSFRFVAVNLYTKTSKIISILSKATGQPVVESVGRITRMSFGMNKKFYVATEGAYGGGGHIIEYDPDTEKAYDLGKPFSRNGQYLAIYSLSMGVDGALYGGSFGGDGDVYTFRYDYNGNWYVDQAPLHYGHKYVVNVSGDSRFTYAALGKNNWEVVAIDRTAGAKKIVLSTTNQIGNLDVAPHVDGVFCKIYQHYKMNGLDEPTALPFPHRPYSPRVEYNPYNVDDPTVPEVEWVSNASKVEYRFPSGEQGSISVNGVFQDIYETSGVSIANNSNIYVSGGKPSSLALYNNNKPIVLGSFPFNVYCSAQGSANSPDADKLFFSGYPKGNLYEYTFTQSWSLGKTFSHTGTSPVVTNPCLVAMLQNPDSSGTYGPMTTGGIVYTKNGYIAVAGNNDRITESGSRELSIGSYKNKCVKNLYQNDFAQYEFMSMCLSYDSNHAFVAAFTKGGGAGKLFMYNPATNSIADEWIIPELTGYGGLIESFTHKLLVGTMDDMIFVYDLEKRQTVYKKVLGSGQRITALAKGPNFTFYTASMYLSSNNSKIQKVRIDNTDPSNIKMLLTYIAEVADEDGDEGLPIQLAIAKKSSSIGSIYISGMKSLYRINNVPL